MRRLELVLVLLALPGCKRAEREAEEQAPSRAAHCEAATQGVVSDRLTLRGVVAPRPDRDALVSPQVAGRILSVLVQEGDVVTAWQVVARVDDAALSDSSREAEAALARAEAEQRNAEASLERVKKVFAHGIAARQEVDDAAARADTSKAATAEAQAALQRVRRPVERSAVRSPLRGVVVKVWRRSGELVDGTSGTPVVEVADVSALELRAQAPVGELVRLTRGDAASVSLPSLPGPWPASVVAVAPAVERTTGLGLVRLSLQLDAGTAVPVGVPGVAEVSVGSPREAVLVPQGAVRSSPRGVFELVLCGGDGLAHVLEVERGARSGRLVEVRGLDAGARVVVAPVLGIADTDSLQTGAAP